MENYDALIETTVQDPERLSTEEWIEMKKEERAELYDTIDKMTDKTFSDPQALGAYLQMQARLGRSSLNNTLLVMAQKPDASYVLTAEAWQERGRGIRRGEGKNPIKQFHQDKEYTRDDGSVAMGYKVTRCFDVSQTYGKPVQRRASLGMDLRTKLKALMTDAPVAVQLSGDVPQSIGAVYSPKDNTIHVAKGLEGNTLFFSISRELARAEGCEDTFLCDCAANIACMRFGLEPKLCDRIPDDYAYLSTQDKRATLSEVRSYANEIVERVDRNLYAERLQQKSQPER